jgi:hypothetical protein
LFIELDGQGYLGCLVLEDYAFCQELAKVLRQHFRRTIEEIGSLDLGATL